MGPNGRAGASASQVSECVGSSRWNAVTRPSTVVRLQLELRLWQVTTGRPSGWGSNRSCGRAGPALLLASSWAVGAGLVRTPAAGLSIAGGDGTGGRAGGHGHRLETLASRRA